MREPVDFSTFRDLPYKNADIARVERINGYNIPEELVATLKSVKNLAEERDHLFYVTLKPNLRKAARSTEARHSELLVKPYISDREKEVIRRLFGYRTPVSAVVGIRDDYFVEEPIRTPSLDTAVEENLLSVENAARMFGEGIRLVHSANVAYNGNFANHVFVDDIVADPRYRVRFSNFSQAVLVDNLIPLMSDVKNAFFYLESLVSRESEINTRVRASLEQTGLGHRKGQYNPEKRLANAVRQFMEGYVRDNKSSSIFEGALSEVTYYEEDTLLVKALNKLRVKSSKDGHN